MKIDPNAPAFPFPSGPEPRVDTFHDRADGVTIRAHFAALAMQGLRAGRLISGMAEDKVRLWTCTDIAAQAVMDADALIAELNKETA